LPRRGHSGVYVACKGLTLGGEMQCLLIDLRESHPWNNLSHRLPHHQHFTVICIYYSPTAQTSNPSKHT